MNGSFVISLDFEMLWGLAGWNNYQINAYKPHIEGSRQALMRIIDTLSRYNIKSTIAFIGGMCFESTNEFIETSPILKPHYHKAQFSSYESILKYVEQTNEYQLLFCKDLILSLASNNLVELASHTFSHYYCLETGQDIDQFTADIQCALQHAKANGIDIGTVIFPRNQVSRSYLQACADLGITHYRGNLDTFLYRSETTPSRFSIRRILRAADTYLNISGSNDFRIQGGCKPRNIPGSRFLRPYSSQLSFLEPLKIRRITKSIEHAAKHKKIYHLWWHPHNFGCNTDENISNLEQICDCFCRMQAKYGMTSKFIKEL